MWISQKSIFCIVILLSTFYFLFSIGALADEFTSSDYKVLEPVTFSGGYSTSSDYSLFGAISQISIGTSTSAGFGINTGFLYFPFASSPVVSATAGDGQVALTWTASQGYLGWTVSGYNVGQSVASGGPYTYSSSLGNVTSSTRTGLTNGTAYYFVVRPEDAFGNSIATSTEVSATPAAPSAYCGDGSCNGSETCSTCPSDCGICPGAGGGIILEFLKLFAVPRPALVLPPIAISPCGTDLNCDGRIGLDDLSILLYLTEEPPPNPADFNNDKKVNGEDLSIMFFKWTERILAFGPEEKPVAFKEKPKAPGLFEEMKPFQPAAIGQVTPEKEEIKEETLVSKFIKSAGRILSKTADIIFEKTKEAMGKIIKFFDISF